MHKLNNDIQMFKGEGGLGGLGGLGRLGGETTETGTRVCGFDGSPSTLLKTKLMEVVEEEVES